MDGRRILAHHVPPFATLRQLGGLNGGMQRGLDVGNESKVRQAGSSTDEPAGIIPRPMQRGLDVANESEVRQAGSSIEEPAGIVPRPIMDRQACSSPEEPAGITPRLAESVERNPES